MADRQVLALRSSLSTCSRDRIERYPALRDPITGTFFAYRSRSTSASSSVQTAILAFQSAADFRSELEAARRSTLCFERFGHLLVPLDSCRNIGIVLRDAFVGRDDLAEHLTHVDRKVQEGDSGRGQSDCRRWLHAGDLWRKVWSFSARWPIESYSYMPGVGGA